MGLDTRFFSVGTRASDQDPDDAGDSSHRQRWPGERIVGEEPDNHADCCRQGKRDDDGFAIGSGPGNQQTAGEAEECGHDVGPGVHCREVRVSAHANHA